MSMKGDFPMFRFLLRQFFALADYTRTILLGSLFLAVFCLFLAALYRFLAPSGDFLRLMALSECLLEAARACLAAGCLSAMICECVWRRDLRE